MAKTRAPRGSNVSQVDWMLRRLTDAGERMTGPREIVVRALVAQNGVINPETLSYDLHPQGVGRATVYRTLVLLASLALPSSPALAQSACSFTGGFALLQSQIPDRVGTCLDNGTSRPMLGEAVQRTTNGLLVYRAVDGG